MTYDLPIRFCAVYIFLGVLTSVMAGALDRIDGHANEASSHLAIAVAWPAHIWSVMERYTAAENAEADRQNRQLSAPVDYIDI